MDSTDAEQAIQPMADGAGFSAQDAGLTVGLSTTSSSPTAAAPIVVTAIFGSSVTGFESTDVVVSNGAVSAFSGSGDTYTIEITPYAAGTVTVSIPADVAQDAGGNLNIPSNTLSIDYIIPPVVTTTGGETSYTERSTDVVVDSNITVTDADSATLPSGTVTISGNYHPGEDELSFVALTSGPIVGGVFDSATGAINFSCVGGVPTPAQWEFAFRCVKYRNTSASPDTSPREITFSVSDGTTASTATKTVTVTATKPEISVPASISVVENYPATISDISFSYPDAASSVTQRFLFRPAQ